MSFYMAVIGAIRERICLLARSERGMALPTAIFALIASFAFATAAVMSSITAQQGTHRDSDSKSAIAAADAGANVALLRMNRFISSFSPTARCISPAGVVQVPDASGWCPATSSESVGGASFTYRVSAYEKNAPMTVVATGTDGTVSRRIEVGLVSYGDEKVFGGEKFIGEAGIELEGDVLLETDIGTNGDVDDKGNSAEICGDIRHGPGKSAPDPDCGGEKTEGNKTLPDIELPPGIETNNWNCRAEKKIATNCPSKSDYDPYIGANGKENRSTKEPWEAGTRTINVGSNSTLTMGGRDYFICRLYLSGGDLIMPAGAEVRVFFDTPEHCGMKSGEVQMRVTGNSHIISTPYNAGTSNVVPGFYVLGSPTIETSIILNGTSGGTNQLMLYAPNSEIEISGNATWVGMAAGDTLRINGTPKVVADDDIQLPDMNFDSLWERTHYIECVGASAIPPDASC